MKHPLITLAVLLMAFTHCEAQPGGPVPYGTFPLGAYYIFLPEDHFVQNPEYALTAALSIASKCERIDDIDNNKMSLHNEYNANGFITARKTYLAGKTRQLVSTQTWDYVYDGARLKKVNIKETGANGHAAVAATELYDYDGSGRVIEHKNKYEDETVTYNSMGQITDWKATFTNSYSAPTSREEKYTYGDDGRVYEKAGTGFLTFTTRFEYNDNDSGDYKIHTIKQTDLNAGKTYIKNFRVVKNSQGQVTEYCNSDNKTQKIYWSNNRIDSVYSFNNEGSNATNKNTAELYTYDGNGKLIKYAKYQVALMANVAIRGKLIYGNTYDRAAGKEIVTNPSDVLLGGKAQTYAIFCY